MLKYLQKEERKEAKKEGRKGGRKEGRKESGTLVYLFSSLAFHFVHLSLPSSLNIYNLFLHHVADVCF